MLVNKNLATGRKVKKIPRKFINDFQTVAWIEIQKFRVVGTSKEYNLTLLRRSQRQYTFS